MLLETFTQLMYEAMVSDGLTPMTPEEAAQDYAQWTEQEERAEWLACR